MIPRKNYPIGTKKMDKEGDVSIKTEKGWMRENRFVAAHSILDRDLNEGEKVFHKDNTLRGTEEFNKPGNLVVIKQAVLRFRLRSSKIVYLPDMEETTDERRVSARSTNGQAHDTNARRSGQNHARSSRHIEANSRRVHA